MYIFIIGCVVFCVYEFIKFKEKEVLGEFIHKDEYKKLISDLKKLSPKEKDELFDSLEKEFLVKGK